MEEAPSGFSSELCSFKRHSGDSPLFRKQHVLSESGRSRRGPLLKEKLIKKAIQYHVIGGSTRLTPQTHGELLEDFLKRGSIDKLLGNIEARAL